MALAALPIQLERSVRTWRGGRPRCHSAAGGGRRRRARLRLRGRDRLLGSWRNGIERHRRRLRRGIRPHRGPAGAATWSARRRGKGPGRPGGPWPIAPRAQAQAAAPRCCSSAGWAACCSSVTAACSWWSARWCSRASWTLMVPSIAGYRRGTSLSGICGSCCGVSRWQPRPGCRADPPGGADPRPRWNGYSCTIRLRAEPLGTNRLSCPALIVADSVPHAGSVPVRRRAREAE